MLLPGPPTEPNQAATKAYADSTASTAGTNATSSANAYTNTQVNNLLTRQPQVWSAGNGSAFGLPANTWTDFSVGPNWSTTYTAQHLITVGASVGCADGEVFLNFKVDGSGYVSPVSAQATCKNQNLWLTLAYSIVLGAGSHTLHVGGNTSGSGGSIRSFVTNVQSLFTS